MKCETCENEVGRCLNCGFQIEEQQSLLNLLRSIAIQIMNDDIFKDTWWYDDGDAQGVTVFDRIMRELPEEMKFEYTQDNLQQTTAKEVNK